MRMIPSNSAHDSGNSRGRTLQALYLDFYDRRKHMRAVEQLALDLDRSINEISPLYEDVLAALRKQAHIQDYLPILVSKRIKQLLSH